MTIHSFIAGTPLHVMISLSLIRQLNLKGIAHLKILDYFSGAEDVFRRISEMKWDYSDVKISFFSSHRRAYLDCIKDNTEIIYLDGDASFQRYMELMAIKIMRPNMKICVFEDGVGSYRTDIYRGIKKRIFDTIGVGTFLGGSPFTKSVFVYDLDRYKDIFKNTKADIFKIEESLSDTISRLGSDLCDIFGYSQSFCYGGDECSIYLSSWEVDTDFIDYLKKSGGDVFVKLHPHIKDIKHVNGMRLIKNTVPAEIILSHMADIYETVKVYHHGSSVEQYICNDNIEFIRI